VEINFCRRCGSRLTPKGSGAYECENGHHVYYKGFPAVGVLLLNSKNDVLLAVRGIEPAKGALDSPGGFCNPEETFEDAAARELKEELGLEPSDYGELSYLCGAISTYPYEGEQQKNIHVIFWARLTDDTMVINPTDDVSGIQWVPLSEVDFDALASTAASERVAIKKLQQQLL
jgi:ADP-ribose pyrophosphatase YjhB (NUDIX family)